MSCPCKKPLKKAAKYSEEGDCPQNEEATNIFEKIANIFLGIIGGILSSVLFIIVAIPAVLWLAIKKLFGKDPILVIHKSWFMKTNNKRSK